MKVVGARIALGAVESCQRDFCVHNGRITFECADGGHEKILDLSGFLLLPGLINAHDHLELNLFPKLGSGPYNNAKAWADDIHRPLESPVREQLALRKRDRLLWGALKNLMSGVTTVAHHNPFDEALSDPAFPVNVVKQFGWAHSLDFSPDLQDRFRATPSTWPFIVHAAEGVDERARSEIAKLDALGVLSDRTVLIHALGLDPAGADLLKARQSGIVWCPTSNLSVYGSTLSRLVFQTGINIALGTDSAMTAQTDLIDEIRVGQRVSGLDWAELYEMVTVRAARLLRLRDGQGEIRDGGDADLVAVPDCGQSPAAALDGMTPELVMIGGAIRLIAPAVKERIRRPKDRDWPFLSLEGRGRWLTDIDLPSLYEETVRALGPEFRLAGKRVSL